ncbi:MAG: Crp/Fnr family transcriptional regulator [Peptococcaceae bacterium]|nr:Crp/Fnr family transcriptional regulator [Peptococcaceae bacterium]MBO5300932.1 Crp/Fnr family transcriptional regulator [Peptococcaceae bacterium]MBO5365831.1 Crp/Fnr family transcriptional regulator [Peptococcaceae bacterium]MBP3342580.1 Crp/Fnr family transcriptional regulator [Peptococcaceae bacterium]MBP3585673.1 Crp/Fnr family transcriptional regulator [Peptococcaceae bacterium]
MPFRDLPGVTQCRFRKGERIMRAGEPIEYVYYLTKGTVYREVVTDKGYESILGSKGGADIARSLVGILAAYNRNNRDISTSDFVAHTDCIAYRVPTEKCKEYLRQNPRLLEEVLQCSMDEYQRVIGLLQTKREGTASAHLCALLLERARDTEEGLVVSRKCTNVEISKLLSIHKVTVSRMLRALKEEGCVERSAAGLRILQPEQLRKYADGELILEYE